MALALSLLMLAACSPAEKPQDTLYPEPQIKNEPNKALEYIIASLFMAAATCLIVLEIRNKK